jgi:hypothetical protein
MVFSPDTLRFFTHKPPANDGRASPGHSDLQLRVPHLPRPLLPERSRYPHNSCTSLLSPFIIWQFSDLLFTSSPGGPLR